VLATHAYGDNGIYTVTITVTDDDNDTTSDTFTFTVNNVTPSIEAGPSHVIDESGPVTINPTFSDPGFTVPSAPTVETFTATIDWGEGTVESRTVTVNNGNPALASRLPFERIVLNSAPTRCRRGRTT
jgi:PKD repeat protein